MKKIIQLLLSLPIVFSIWGCNYVFMDNYVLEKNQSKELFLNSLSDVVVLPYNVSEVRMVIFNRITGNWDLFSKTSNVIEGFMKSGEKIYMYGPLVSMLPAGSAGNYWIPGDVSGFYMKFRTEAFVNGDWVKVVNRDKNKLDKNEVCKASNISSSSEFFLNCASTRVDGFYVFTHDYK